MPDGAPHPPRPPGAPPSGAPSDRAPASPEPLSALPSTTARVLAFVSILVAGLAGGLIGYGFVDLQGGSSGWSALGALVGAVAAAAGTAVIAVLVLRAMGEWKRDTTPL